MEKELIPQYIGIGGTYDDFMHLNPRKLEVIYKGYRERMKHSVDEMYENARYVFYAHSVALANFSIGFSGKHKKMLRFEEEVERPKFDEPEKQDELTRADKKKYTELIFANLRLRQANFELSKGGKK